MIIPSIELTVEERDLILSALGDKIPEALHTKLNPYIPQSKILKDVFVLRWKKPNDTPENSILDWKISTTKVDYVDDVSPTHYECWINHNYHKPLKTDVFTYRWEATVAGHKRHLKLLEDAIDMEKKDIDWVEQYKIVGDHKEYIKMIKSIKRKIYLIEDFPEKQI